MLYVCIHAFAIRDGGDNEYCDARDETPSGWNVYVRRDHGQGLPFDIVEDTDFPDRESALAYAQSKAAELNCEIDEY